MVSGAAGVALSLMVFRTCERVGWGPVLGLLEWVPLELEESLRSSPLSLWGECLPGVVSARWRAVSRAALYAELYPPRLGGCVSER